MLSMRPIRTFGILLVILQICLGEGYVSADNLTCYQCTRTSNVLCGEESLLPCPSQSDRCVTNIIKNAQDGFTIKRECGLGPCGFDDEMTNKGLGMDTCDRSKDEYFCVFCCKGNGCNKNAAERAIFQPRAYLIGFMCVLFGMFTS